VIRKSAGEKRQRAGRTPGRFALSGSLRTRDSVQACPPKLKRRWKCGGPPPLSRGRCPESGTHPARIRGAAKSAGSESRPSAGGACDQFPVRFCGGPHSAPAHFLRHANGVGGQELAQGANPVAPVARASPPAGWGGFLAATSWNTHRGRCANPQARTPSLHRCHRHSFAGKWLRSRFLRQARSVARADPSWIGKRRTTKSLRKKIEPTRPIRLHGYGPGGGESPYPAFFAWLNRRLTEDVAPTELKNTMKSVPLLHSASAARLISAGKRAN
jgi:hypothetical protein